VVFNLVANAFKFTREGEVRVTTRAAGEGVEVSVSDTGVGIPPEQIAHLFERFHQVPGGWARSHEGLGIGLALVREIVELHGGTVTVDSAEGRGTTFLVTVPMGAAHLPADHVHAEHPAPAALAAGVAGGIGDWSEDGASASRRRGRDAPAEGRILVVDDSADMRGYLRGLLEQHWDVDLVADGPTALQRIHSTKPDLVLADVIMPGLDGLELVRRLRGDPATANVPVLLLSARAGHEAAVEGLLAGADDYLAKPFSASELTARIRSRLELLRARRRETTLATALLSITQAILAGEHLDRVLPRLSRNAAALLEADGACVARSTADGEAVEVLATVGVARGLASQRLPVRQSLLGAVLRSGRGRIVGDLYRS
jgi:CheY-like chemotaxis protein